MSALAMAGPYVASGVALVVAVYADYNRRVDKRSAGRAKARDVVVVSWPEPKVTNASSGTIRNIAMTGGDRFTTKYGTYIDWHCEATLITDSVPSVPLLTAGESHRYTDGHWSLSDQAGNMYGGDWRDRLEYEDRGVAANIEWTDSHGAHWRRIGAEEPVKIRKRSAAPTFPAAGTN